ncbi:hypothetical protein SAMN05444365_1011185 [Micromonospora pattaloongensis]|uniref:Uncharacterized protein n=1 Tax=Micromonospora pattaloongensis TaxID=405436 RepID=A0A1H3IA63_9ACTN|nr:hypothetical protein [Micromonospora pattaloongensis]SDY24616.1 hypothetical protein SAMN05444365_1011185 [Micromonospora pattaloongensis]
MTSSVWLHKDEDFRPGAELFRSERHFEWWSYSATHGQLLLRADSMPGAGHRLSTTTEVLFKPVDAVQMQGTYRGLVIRCATEEEAAQIDRDTSGWCLSEKDRVLMLESEGVTDYVITAAVGWCEGVLSDLQPSFFNTFSAYDPMWPVKPLHGVGGEFDIASPHDVAEAFLTGLPEGVRRERHRYVHVLTAVTEENGRRSRHNVGVFLTETDAEEAKRLVEPHVASCWIEPLAVVL